MQKALTLFFFFSAFIFSTTLFAHPGIGIVMDSKGNVYYTDLEHVWKISPDGQMTIAVEGVHTHQLHIDEHDDLYGEHVWYEGEATDKWGYSVWCLSADGLLEQTVPPTEGFPDNNTLVRDTEGNSYFAGKSGDQEVLMVETTDGTSSFFSDHRFRDIRWLHFDKHSGDLYAVDYLQVKRISPSGKVDVVADHLKEKQSPFSGVSDHHYLFGLWTDPKDNLYIAVYGAGKIKRVDATGKIETVYQSENGWSPCGGMVGPDGSWWIMEFSSRNKTRVKKILPNKEELVFEP